MGKTDTGTAVGYERSPLRPEMLSDDARDFSLVSGGPFYQLLRRAGLVSTSFDSAGLRIIVITMVAWLPLLILTVLGGRLASGIKIPFIRDVEVQSRLLLVLPLMIAAEVTIHRRMRQLILQFVERRIVGPKDFSTFEGHIQSALRLRNSEIIEGGLFALVIVGGYFWWHFVLALQSDTWYAAMSGGHKVLSPAGYWYVFVSLPIVQFIGIRWYFRLLVWARLLWQISRMNLRLVPSHPDSCFGLGFLGQIVFALAPLLLAHSVLLAGFIGDRILYEGSKLPEHGVDIAAMAIFMFLFSLGPLCVFTPRMMQQRQQGLFKYGPLASEYVIEFDAKWIESQRSPDEPLVGTSDIQSLADLANSFSVVQHVQLFPFGREAIISLAVIVALPLLPLTLTMFSAKELALKLLKVLF
jgi:hypothetical protein